MYLNRENIERSTNEVEWHPLIPFLPENARVLFLGSFPPQRKRWCIDFYYPNFINDHWRIEGQVFFDDRNHFVDVEKKRFKLEEIVAFCLSKGIAFFDTSTAIRRLKDNASDKFLEVVVPTDIPTLLARLPHLRPDTYNMDGQQLVLYRLPSSSRAYPLAFDKKVAAYRQMFDGYFSIDSLK